MWAIVHYRHDTPNMGVVHFKLRSAVEQYQVGFDGMTILVSELKDAIRQRLCIDKDYRSDVKLFNAKTNEGALQFMQCVIDVGCPLIACTAVQNMLMRM